MRIKHNLSFLENELFQATVDAIKRVLEEHVRALNAKEIHSIICIEDPNVGNPAPVFCYKDGIGVETSEFNEVIKRINSGEIKHYVELENGSDYAIIYAES